MRHNKIALCAILVIVLSATIMAATADAATDSQGVLALSVIAADGKDVTLTVKGSVDADQISELWFASNPALYNNTDIAFTLTRQNSVTEFMNMTVPKDALLGGTSPVVTIDGALVEDSGYSQDSDNFYVWFTALSNSGHIDRSSVQITFLLTPKLTTVGPSMGYLYTMGAVIVSVLLAALFLLLVYKRFYDKQRLRQQAKLV